MRAAGVPARVVTGYQGGEINPIDGFMTVRQFDAHAWAEVWLAGRGWTRVDPTAASYPRRIDGNLAAALPAGERVPLLMRADWTWLHDLRLRWDAGANTWNQWRAAAWRAGRGKVRATMRSASPAPGRK